MCSSHDSVLEIQVWAAVACDDCVDSGAFVGNSWRPRRFLLGLGHLGAYTSSSYQISWQAQDPTVTGVMRAYVMVRMRTVEQERMCMLVPL